MEVLRTARLILRQMWAGDLDDVAGLLGDPEVMRYYPAPKSRDQAHAWIDWNVDNYEAYGFALWVVETVSGEFVGDCGLTMHAIDGRQDVEIDYHVRAELQGLCNRAATACREYAAALGVRRLIAIIAPENGPSQRVATKLGLTLERTADVHGSQQRIYSTPLPISAAGRGVDQVGAPDRALSRPHGRVLPRTLNSEAGALPSRINGRRAVRSAGYPRRGGRRG